MSTYALPLTMNRVTARDRVFLIRQLAVMISSGVPLATALPLITQQVTNPRVRRGLQLLTQDIENGHAFSTSAGRQSDLFDPISIAMIRSGEASGQLEKVLADLAEELEKDMSFRTKVRNALLYPAFVMFVMVVVGVIMATVVMPRLGEIFNETNVALPWSTQVLLGISYAIINYWYLILLILAALIYAFRRYMITPAGRLALYHFETKVPLFRDLVINSYLVRFTNALGMLTHSGVPITESIQIASDALANKIWADALELVRQDVERGIPLSTALSRNPIFPPALTQMITVGEQTGKLDSVLGTLSDYYEEQTNNTVKSITTLIEPVVLILVAVAVGFVVISVLLPIYGLSDQI